ncbi:MAG: nucleoside triphosphate pyrophosphatase [Pseudomonadota bacterium]
MAPAVILASGSASRRAILEGAGVPFAIQKPCVDEETLKATYQDKSPAELALALAKSKALSIDAPGAVVIGADQVMEFDGQPFDKPKSKEELKLRLAKMAGQPHHLRGGVALVKDGEILETIQETSTLTMRPLSETEIEGYVAALPDDIALGTVGGYALEGLGARLFSSVDGDFFSILGLPLFPVLRILRTEGVLPW